MIELQNYTSVEINSTCCNRNSIFVCFKNNLKYVKDAIKNGATLIIHKENIKKIEGVTFLKVNDINHILKMLIEYYYPIKLKLIGITGTDGKTSTSLIIYSLLNQVDSCGYIGTNGVKFNNYNIDTKNTTPDVISLRKYLYQMSNDNINYVTIECSSEGILNNRLLGLTFDIIIFTNLSHEHLNTHKTMKRYFKTKLTLLKYLKYDGEVFVNIDDKYFKNIHGTNVKYYGLSNSDSQAKNINSCFETTSFNCSLYGNNPITIPLFGIYNVYNCLAATLVMYKYNFLHDVDYSKLEKISGRFEMVERNNKKVIIDFAHTPNALENLLYNIKLITNKKIILILGSAGEKDKTKRPLLGSIASKYADEIILTSEDPKSESITNIFYDLIRKIKKEYYLVLFRKDAIKLGLEMLDDNSILVIVGKGLENYEQIYSFKFKHNDLFYTKQLLNS